MKTYFEEGRMLMKKIKVMTVFGTRPEAIKMAPLVLELQKQSQRFETITTVSAQHREMLDQVLDIFHRSLKSQQFLQVPVSLHLYRQHL